MAQLERVLPIERTRSGLSRVKADEATPARPVVLDDAQPDAIGAGLAFDVGVSALVRQLGASRQTVMRVSEAAAG